MKQVRVIWRKYRFAVISMTLLFLSFSINIFGLGDSPKWFYEFQQDSSFLVERALICKSQQSYYSGMIVQRAASQGSPASCAEEDNLPYVSQFGLQARLIRLFAPSDSGQLARYLGVVKLLLAFTAAIVMTAIVVRTYKLYGRVPALVLLMGVCVSPWAAAYARNLYWVFPLMVAPFALVYCCYPWFSRSNLRWLMYVAVFVLLLLKLLDGYEHIVTILVSVMAALTIYEYRNLRDSWKRLLGHFVLAGLVGIAAFSTAFLINVVGLNEYYHTYDKSISEVRARAGERGFGELEVLQPYVLFGFERTLPDVYAAVDYYGNISALKAGNGNPMQYAVLSMLNYSLLPALNYPIRSTGILWTILQSIGFLAVIGFISSIKVARQKKQRDYSSLAAMVVSLLGAVGWLVVMPGHAYPHAHLNAIVFYLPFLLLCYIEIGRYVAIHIDRIKAYVTKK